MHHVPQPVSDSDKSALERISTLLDLPTSAFYVAADLASQDVTVDEQAQTVAQLFKLISSQQQRDQVLTLIRLLAL